MPIELAVQPPRRAFVLTGRMVLVMMVGFFVVVAGVNAVMMTMAIRTMPGVDVRSAYETSQNFNGEIARMQAQDARGWKVLAHVGRDRDGALVTVDLHDASGAAVRDLSVSAALRHPASRREDREVILIETAPGRYAARIAAIPGGAWTLVIDASSHARQAFTSRSRLILAD